MKTQTFLVEITDVTGTYPLTEEQVSEALQTEMMIVGLNYHINVVEK